MPVPEKTSGAARHRWRGAIDFCGVNIAALAASRRLVPRLLPGGVLRGDEYIVLNPCRRDRRPGSFSINLRTGKWADFALCDASGGDLISLIAYTHRLRPADAAVLMARTLGAEWRFRP